MLLYKTAMRSGQTDSSSQVGELVIELKMLGRAVCSWITRAQRHH